MEERYSDRLAVIPFEAMCVSDPISLQNKANDYTAYISQDAKPTEFVIKEMGDFLRRLDELCQLLH